jgi:hypothetical protein
MKARASGRSANAKSPRRAIAQPGSHATSRSARQGAKPYFAID